MSISARRSLFYSFLDRYASLAISVASTMVLARLLTPNEIGVYAVTMAMLALVSTVRDLGAGQYLLQERELTTERIRSVWAVQLGVGLLLAAVVAGAALPAARFYDDSRVQPIMLLLALNFAINPLGSLTYATLMREMRYGDVAVMRTSSNFGGAAVSIGLAAAGWGPISLAWGSVCSTLINSAISLAYRPAGHPWMPGLGELRRVLAFGTSMTAASVLQTIGNAAPEFLLGKLQGLTAAGLYSRANGLVSMFQRLVTDAVHSVALSVFAKDAREGRASAAAFLHAIASVTALGWSFCIAVVLLAHPIVRLLYGWQWDGAVDVSRVLALGACATCIVPICQAVVVGYGDVRTVFRTSVVFLVLSVAAAVVGAAVGLVPMAAGAALAQVGATAFWLVGARKSLGFRWREFAAALAPSLGVAAVASVAPALTVLAWGWTPDARVLPLGLATAGGAAGFLLGVHWTGHPLRAELQRAAAALYGLLPGKGRGA